MRITRRDWAALLVLAALPVLLLAPTLFTGRVYFLNDLTHISHPWRTLTAELLQRGQLPLWNPYTYFGLPLAGNMQAAPFDPAAMLFHLFPFARALSPFLLAAYWTGTFFAYLWLRRLGAAPGAAAGGAALFAAGGTVACQIQFPNILSTLCWAPALFLFTGCLAPAALAGAAGLLAGYPPAWAGLTASWLVLQAAFETKRRLLVSAASVALALAAAAVAVLPGAELTRVASRTKATPLEERLVQSMDPPDLWSFAQPWITRTIEGRGRPRQLERVRWKEGGETVVFEFLSPAGGEHVGNAAGARYSHLLSAYVGLVGAAAGLFGLFLLARERTWAAALTAAFIGAVFLACLGGTNPVSRWLWEHAPYLKQLRGPARMHFLMLAAAPVLVALGLARAGKRSPVLAAAWAGALVVELAAASWGFHPTQPAEYYARTGVLASFLRDNLGGLRYFQIPEIQLWPHVSRRSEDPRFERFRRLAYEGYKDKLFGLANLPFHLEAATGGYEPLVPEGVDLLVRTLRREEDQRGLGNRLAWLGCRILLENGPLAPHLVGHEGALLPGRVLERGTHLWEAYEAPEAARARWLPEAEKGRLGGDVLTAGEPAGVPVLVEKTREDRFGARGEAPSEGRLFLVEPYYPGWKAYVNGIPATIEKALEAFIQVRVPKGPWKASFVYEPASFLAGAWLSVAMLAGLAIYAVGLLRGGDFQ